MYKFINDKHTKFVYLGNTFAIGKRKQEETFLVFEPQQETFLDKPEKYPTAKKTAAGYVIQYFLINFPKNIDKRKRVFLDSRPAAFNPNRSDIEIDVAFVFRMRAMNTKESQIDSAGTAGGQLAIFNTVMANIQPILKLLFLTRLAQVLFDRYKTAYKEAIEQYLKKAVKDTKENLKIYKKPPKKQGRLLQVHSYVRAEMQA